MCSFELDQGAVCCKTGKGMGLKTSTEAYERVMY